MFYLFYLQTFICTYFINVFQVRINHSALVEALSLSRVLSALSCAHRYEFSYVLELLCQRMTQLIPIPNNEQIQFAERLDLDTVLKV